MSLKIITVNCVVATLCSRSVLIDAGIDPNTFRVPEDTLTVRLTHPEKVDVKALARNLEQQGVRYLVTTDHTP